MAGRDVSTSRQLGSSGHPPAVRRAASNDVALCDAHHAMLAFAMLSGYGVAMVFCDRWSRRREHSLSNRRATFRLLPRWCKPWEGFLLESVNRAASARMERR